MRIASISADGTDHELDLLVVCGVEHWFQVTDVRASTARHLLCAQLEWASIC